MPSARARAFPQVGGSGLHQASDSSDVDNIQAAQRRLRPGAVHPSAHWRARAPKTKHAVPSQMCSDSSARPNTMPCRVQKRRPSAIPCRVQQRRRRRRQPHSRGARRTRALACRWPDLRRRTSRCGQDGAYMRLLASAGWRHFHSRRRERWGPGPCVCLFVSLWFVVLLALFFPRVVCLCVAPFLRFMLCEYCAASGAVPQALAAVRLCAASDRPRG
jgi:hypothetical protein